MENSYSVIVLSDSAPDGTELQERNNLKYSATVDAFVCRTGDVDSILAEQGFKKSDAWVNDLAEWLDECFENSEESFEIQWGLYEDENISIRVGGCASDIVYELNDEELFSSKDWYADFLKEAKMIKVSIVQDMVNEQIDHFLHDLFPDKYDGLGGFINANGEWMTRKITKK